MKGDAWMVRRMVCILAAAVLLTGLRLPAEAQEKTGSVHVKLDYGDMVVREGAVMLCPVATPLDGCYRLMDIYGGGVIRREDACSPEVALWLAEQMPKESISRLLDADGSTYFSDLEEGLYLLVQTRAPEGYACALPFLVPIPLDGQWNVYANPKTAQLITESPQTGEHPAPLIGAMGLVLSGMGLYVCGERILKRRRLSGGNNRHRKRKKQEKYIDKKVSGGYNV